MIHLDVRDRVAALVLGRPPVSAFDVAQLGRLSRHSTSSAVPGRSRWWSCAVRAVISRRAERLAQIIAALLAGTCPAQPAIKQCVARAASAEGYASETASQCALHASAEAGTRLRAFLAERRGR